MPDKQQQDKLYSTARQVQSAFQFDDQVAQVFTDMITRSVPGYTMMLDMLGVLSEQVMKSGDTAYDIGCSLGASTLAIRQNIQADDCHIIGVDSSEAMLERCEKVIERDNSKATVELKRGKAQSLEFSPMRLCSMNLTLQFIPKEERLALLKNIAANIQTGGALFLSEKVVFDDHFKQQQLTDLHHQFKKHQGYSDLEVAQKRQAIENVLIPESIESHRKRLLDAGFSKVILALQCFNFVAFIAYK